MRLHFSGLNSKRGQLTWAKTINKPLLYIVKGMEYPLRRYVHFITFILRFKQYFQHMNHANMGCQLKPSKMNLILVKSED
ncbi:hypothetical protein RIF29_16123 [Crotalaria pallida]|uniref:Uncharacterized protein n=1 Tax=Crotalaria pallida TaxID=3830 RepID=A0AAN9ID87_CROPI